MDETTHALAPASQRAPERSRRGLRLWLAPADARLWLNPAASEIDWALAAEIVLHHDSGLRPFQTQGLRGFIDAEDIRQIQAAVAFAEQEGLRAVIVGGYDAHGLVRRGG